MIRKIPDRSDDFRRNVDFTMRIVVEKINDLIDAVNSLEDTEKEEFEREKFEKWWLSKHDLVDGWPWNIVSDIKNGRNRTLSSFHVREIAYNAWVAGKKEGHDGKQ